MPRKRLPDHVFLIRLSRTYEPGESHRIVATFDKVEAIFRDEYGITIDPLIYQDGNLIELPKDKASGYDTISVDRLPLES